eukprot:TRINITY_DN69587_c0_g1_i1.p1 TRINITY_DN69587_c0_g1~~TRINITY_DN69587_c0_g1_i1.p1  ORF type:complete len:450 (+),score=54.32 TRINITY_DN69587_c0_g1_i1:90-1439(+)
MSPLVVRFPCVLLVLQLSNCNMTLADSGLCRGSSSDCALQETATPLDGEEEGHFAADRSLKSTLRNKSIQDLRRIIMSCGLRHSDCFEKEALRVRALEAMRKNSSGKCLPQIVAESSPLSGVKKPAADKQRKAESRSSEESRRRKRNSAAGSPSLEEAKKKRQEASRTQSRFGMTVLPQSVSELKFASVESLRARIRQAGENASFTTKEEMRSLVEDIFKKPRALPRPAPITRKGRTAHVLTPKTLKQGDALPLLFVLHGAGRTKESIQRMVLQFSKIASRSRCLVIVPASYEQTWDTLRSHKQGTRSADTDFVEFVLNEVSSKYFVDRGRIGALGFSDGGSYALTLAVNNHHVFQAAMAWSAGYYLHDPQYDVAVAAKPRILHGHGKSDDHFDFKKVGLHMRRQLKSSGYHIATKTPQEAGHGTPPSFVEDSIKWWLGLAPHPASSTS